MIVVMKALFDDFCLIMMTISDDRFEMPLLLLSFYVSESQSVSEVYFFVYFNVFCTREFKESEIKEFFDCSLFD